MRALFWNLIKRVLFLLEPETAHRVMVALVRLGSGMGNLPLRIASGDWSAPSSGSIRVWDLEFRSRLGLAAGFDKDAEIVTGLPALGFGFVEIGTVTPRPQAGNDRPRLFRDPVRRAIFNRMGFNGLGATAVSARLRDAQADLPADFRVGVNIGKNKVTPLEEAAGDYEAAARAFEGLVDYLVINVSSPNTPGLRSLQTVEALKPIVQKVRGVVDVWMKRPPLLLKIAPEVEGDDLSQLIRGLEGEGLGGWVLTNTLSGVLSQGGKEYSGGWSGSPLTEKSRARLLEARSLTRLPIISVGGVLDAEEALERLLAGADLVQVYSGWIYGGPAWPVRISKKMRDFQRK